MLFETSQNLGCFQEKENKNKDICSLSSVWMTCCNSTDQCIDYCGSNLAPDAVGDLANKSHAWHLLSPLEKGCPKRQS